MSMATKQAGIKNMYLKCLGVYTGDHKMLFSYFIIYAYFYFKIRSYAYAYSLLFGDMVKVLDVSNLVSKVFFLSSIERILRRLYIEGLLI